MLGSSIIFIGNSHPIYLPYWANKRKVKYVDTEEYYKDLLTYCQTDINSKSNVIIKKLENKYKIKRLKDDTIKRIHLSYRDVLSGRKLSKHSVKLILDNELVESLEKHDVDVRVIKSICQYQLLQEYIPKNKRNERNKKNEIKEENKHDIKNKFLKDLCLLGRKQEELFRLNSNTRVSIMNKWVKQFLKEYPDHILEKDIRNILRAYKLTLYDVNTQCEFLVFKGMLEKKLVDCGVNKGFRTLVLASEQEMFKKKVKKVEKNKKLAKPKNISKENIKPVKKSVKEPVKEPVVTKECFKKMTTLVREEGQKGLNETHVLNHSWIVEELSREYEIGELKHNMIFIVVAYQFYMYEVEKGLSQNSDDLLSILHNNLMDCGVPDIFYKGILEAEKNYLEEKANKDMQNYCQQKNADRKKEKCCDEEKIFYKMEVTESTLKNYYRDLCGLLIRADCYEEQDIIKALKRRYKQDILDESKLILLIDIYKYMTEPLSNIKDDTKRLQIITPHLKQCLQLVELEEDIIKRIMENGYTF